MALLREDELRSLGRQYMLEHGIPIVDKPKRDISGWMYNHDRKTIIAVDFDGTIVEDGAGPNKEKLKFLPGAPEAIRWMYDNFYIILWTCRQGMMLEDAAEFLFKNDLRFHSVNDNCPDTPFSTSRKIFADFYIDDRASVTPIDWTGMQNFLTDKFLNKCSSTPEIVSVVIKENLR